jgi:hypothetical protein
MPLSFSAGAAIAAPGSQYLFSSLLALAPQGQPEYLVLTGLDRERYAGSSNGDRGTLTGNGHTLTFQSPGGADTYNFAVVFTATDKGYFNPTYGYLTDLSFRASTDANRTEALSLYGFGSAGAADSALLAKITATLADPNYGGLGFTSASVSSPDPLAYLTSNYLGTLDVVTRAGYVDATPGQATPAEIAAAAAGYVGQFWNQDGCWNLACNISASAGASLPLTSTKSLPTETPPVGNGEWFVAYNSAGVPADQQVNWVSHLKMGDVVVADNTCGGHVATVVSGYGYSSRIIDNYGVPGAGGSPTDVVIRPAHDLLNLIIPADPRNIVIYRLDAPEVTALKTASVAASGSVSLSDLFSAADPAGKAITGFQVYDAAAGTGGSFVVGGVSQAANSAASALTIGAADLASATFLAGGAAGAHTIEVRAFNGSYWGDWQATQVYVGSSAAPPVLRSVSGELRLHGGQSLALSSLITTDAAGSAITSYTIDDPKVSGQVMLNDVTPLASSISATGHRTLEVSAADFARLTYVGGSNIGGELLTITAHNAAAIASNPVSVSVATIAPLTTGVSHYVGVGTAIPITSLFSVVEPDGAQIQSYTIVTQVPVLSWGANTPSSGGSIHLNGVVPLPSFLPGEITIAAADIGKVTFTAAPDAGAQILNFYANDGGAGTPGTTMITTTASATLVTARPHDVAWGQSIAAASLFDLPPGVQAPVYYRVVDPAGGGSIQLDPSVTNYQPKSDATPGVFVIRASDLDKLTYVGGQANASEAIAISTSADNFHWTAEAPLAVTTVAPTNPTVTAAVSAILRQAAPTGDIAQLSASLAGSVNAGTMTASQAATAVVQKAIDTTSVATLAYQYFTGAAPSSAGIDYLVSPSGPNPNNLNSGYYQAFGLENRYINFAVNLGKNGAGAAAFAQAHGAESLQQTLVSAYTTIFGAAPSAAKVDILLNTQVPDGLGGTYARASYFASYGGDGLTGIGTKAAIVGWLLAEAEKTDLGAYAHSNDAFLTDVALHNAPFGVDIIGHYNQPGFTFNGG